MKYKTLLILLIFSLILSGCGDKEPLRHTEPIRKRQELLMGTLVEISIADEDKDATEIDLAIDKAFKEIKRIEDLLSPYNKDSEISRINRLGEREAITVSDETFSLIKRSIEFSRISEGAFDITVAPLLELWGFSIDPSAGSPVIPSEEEVKTKLSLVGWDRIITHDRSRSIAFSRAGMKIDLAAIAKGYAVDRAIEALRGEGITRAIVDAGGDIYCLGAKSETEPWVIGIKDPRRPNEILNTLDIIDRAIVTSGDYERYFIVEGKRYSHIIDPRTGYPVQNKVMSVTILAPGCLEADALATAVFVMGEEKGAEFIDQFDSVEVIIKTLDE